MLLDQGDIFCEQRRDERELAARVHAARTQGRQLQRRSRSSSSFAFDQVRDRKLH